MRQILFSRQYPSYHPKAGQPTYFVEKIMKWYMSQVSDMALLNIPNYYEATGSQINTALFDEFKPKLHTIRAGEHWQEGEVFAPKVWTGVAYKSKTYQFLPPIAVKQIIPLTIEPNVRYGWAKPRLCMPDADIAFYKNELVALNDGLSLPDFWAWFAPEIKKNKAFHGQIICWDKVDYNR